MSDVLSQRKHDNIKQNTTKEKHNEIYIIKNMQAVIVRMVEAHVFVECKRKEKDGLRGDYIKKFKKKTNK